ncbi:arsenate reductase (glutaredoxin) [Maribacter cobaltidurans]|uniref:Arsenate reductase (Glutaredoxin) n=1 Tax=Maribacter cobaltidurans TaxID=1178778 RepID=A0A223V0T8_9FLAO|nr:arsenate reductase (glutaredoxin) [Maribacter cobaltidurans]ASV28790.1 arsenate reductase (glutaredoxin) [Maribacter cobaltidurans]GGD74777.1 arsenate reductase (glutaredoxin) [Maribacter cobaltidurans]
MITIYHNPRCRKSREGLQILENSGKEFEVRKYLEDVPTIEELRQILKYLNIPAEKLVRKNESIWKEEYKNKELSEEEIINAMLLHPKLIERPIVIKDNEAVIGRPPENIEQLIS